jgi:hypothetical protein
MVQKEKGDVGPCWSWIQGFMDLLLLSVKGRGMKESGVCTELKLAWKLKYLCSILLSFPLYNISQYVRNEEHQKKKEFSS